MSVSSIKLSGISNQAKDNRMSNPGLDVFEIGYLIVAGGGAGGGGGGWYGGGGGGGGYVTSEGTSGGNTSAAPKLQVQRGESLTVTVGAGGVGNTQTAGQKGSNSRVGQVFAYGGGTGNRFDAQQFKTGGSGGGSGDFQVRGEAIVNQGFNGGQFGQGGSGGGGAGGLGQGIAGYGGGPGGPGLASTITGSSVTRSAGGGGSGVANSTPANSGNGGAGGLNSGASGIVVLKYPINITMTIGAGLTSSTTTSGDFKITTLTAGTGTVTFS